MKEEGYDETKLELHGAVQLLHDFSLMHLRQRNCVESVATYEVRNGKVKPFNELESLTRIRRQTQKFMDALNDYKKHI